MLALIIEDFFILFIVPHVQIFYLLLVYVVCVGIC